MQKTFEHTIPSYLKLGLVISLLVHLMLALLVYLGIQLGWPLLDFFSAKFGMEKVKQPIIEIIDVKDLPEAEQEKLRTVGLPDSKEKNFSLPLFEKKPMKSRELKSPPTPSLRDLNTKQNTDQQMEMANTQKHITIDQMSEAELIQLKADASFGPPVKLSTNTISEFATSPMDEYVLSKSSFNFKMSPPHGVPLDQLNSSEKIFYTFNRRTFETYINAFLSTYRQISTNHPQIDPKLAQDVHRLVGKLTFDRNGNIISIKMIKWANDDLVQKLFLDTLTNINAIPNPPKALLDNRGEFYIYFQLNINDQ
ncbi:MAG: hypothetical protein HYV97_00045 [Bdellovibrio sp.]|nr:hypothetical protein [Bdellovibrio sp.]